ncbi:efflux RND transporter periplasmic adaptor subunit [Lutimonas saemankumensis]|uniref:efflux RND transporter periplasmic adaptor subunit n=1 Tax=Lutimonas saemankumensis TaxID=483016 RepID=UPI001CD4666B|nr:efflux RND transporter periplasmic adaptor subunit [Lutimonas saemankumensis]MCA0932315.1 efflux RND transporter periplasmic adaptor subunit [Lutimonas saemankumensis]
MKKIYFLFLLSVLISSCKKGDDQKVMPPQPFEVYEIHTESVPLYEEFVGQVYGEKDIPIRARVEGFLTGIHFDEGQRVNEGQLLYTIDPEPFQEKVVAETSKVSEAKTVLVQAESDLRRIEPLAAMAAVSQQELDMAVSKRDAAQSSLEAAKANLNIAKINLGYSKMYAPIEGIIGKTNAREGEFVGKDPNPVILNTVSQLRNIRFQFFLSENDYLKIAREYISRTERKIERSDSADVGLRLILADGEEFPEDGKIDFIDRNIDSSTGSILIQATFPNPDRLIRPGQFARIRVQFSRADDAILIPQKCALELQGQYSVYVVNAENKLESRQIKVGETVGEFYLVQEGLNAGDKILMEGLQRARQDMEIIPNVTEFQSKKVSKL